uniref:Uncharacterized protein n=1 Tax=Anopheles stephensi TaxID=30069 RepID=A0A182Y3E2_ANOST
TADTTIASSTTGKKTRRNGTLKKSSSATATDISMRVWFALFALLTAGALTVTAEDSRTELIGCSSTLFHLAANRISRQFEEFVECKQTATDCREPVQRGQNALQQGLVDYMQCTEYIH